MPTSTKTMNRARRSGTAVTAASAVESNTAPKRRVKTLVTGKVNTHKRLASVPERKYAEGYIKRQLGPGLSDFILFDYAMASHQNVLIEGPTGAGKTSAIMAWAADRELPFYSVSSSIGIEPSQLFGKFIPDNANGIVWQDGPVTDLVRHGGVLLINEINFIPDRIGTVLFSLLDKRREIQLMDHQGEVIRAHEDLVIFADMNPDYSGTHPLNQALRNRFDKQLYFDYDPRIEGKLVPYVPILNLASQIRDRIKTGEFETPVSTNMLFEFVMNYEYLGIEFAVQNFVNHFNADERDPLSKVIQAQLNEIKESLKGIKRLTPYGEPAVTRKEGVYGVNWKYEDDDEDDEAETEEETEVEDGNFEYSEAEDVEQ